MYDIDMLYHSQTSKFIVGIIKRSTFLKTNKGKMTNAKLLPKTN